MREQLQALDPAVLLDVVRQDRRDPSFVILDWTVEVLSEKGAVNPEGLWRFSGQGQSSSGVSPWSVALKVLKNSGDNANPRLIGYWKREYLAQESGLLAALPGHVTQARSYGASDHGASAWLWMELVSDTTGAPWGLDEYAFAARQLGRLNGACATGEPVPGFPWYAASHVETWTSMFPPDEAWANPLVRQLFTEQTRTGVMELWQERERFLAILRRMPQAFSHFDYKRSNLFIRSAPDGQKEIVAVDWGDCGVGALGGDLTRLVGGSTFFYDWDAGLLPELDTVAFAAYIGGLRDVGWQGDPELVRLAYTGWFALDWGCTAPNVVAMSTTDEGQALIRRVCDSNPEEVAANLAPLCEFALALAEESRQLAARL
jgi:hypothetical protein